VAEAGLLEWANSRQILYGTPRPPGGDAPWRRGQPVLLEIELEGPRQVRRSFPPQGFQLLINRPSFADWSGASAARATDSGPRQSSAGSSGPALELSRPEAEFDAVLVNGDLGQALDRNSKPSSAWPTG